MKSNSFKRNLAAASIATAFAMVGSTAFAAGGNVSSVSVTPNAVFGNESVNLKVSANQGSFGIDCKMHWAVRSANNAEVKGGNVKMQSATGTADYAVSFSMPTPGSYTVEATGGPSDSQSISCGGKVTAQLTIKDKNAINANPGLGIAPRPAPIAPVAPVVNANPGLGIAPRPAPIAPVAPVVSGNPVLGLTPTKITGITVASNYVEAGKPFFVKVNGVGTKPEECATSIIIDQLAPKQVNDYGNPPSNWKSGGWPRSDTFIIKEEGTYQVRILFHDWAYNCAAGGVPGNLTKLTVGPAIAK